MNELALSIIIPEQAEMRPTYPVPPTTRNKAIDVYTNLQEEEKNEINKDKASLLKKVVEEAGLEEEDEDSDIMADD